MASEHDGKDGTPEDGHRGDDTRNGKPDRHRQVGDDDGADRDGKDGDGNRDGKDGNGDGTDDKDGDDKDGDDSDDGPPLYKRPLFWIVVVGVLVALLVGGTLWWLHARRFESTDDAFIDTHLVRIAAQTTGQLTQVAPIDNRHVKAGQLLAIIEPGGPEATRAEAQAGIAQADAQVREAAARVLSARASVRQSQANAAVPLAEAARAQGDYERYQHLRALDPLAAAPTQIDQARAQAQSAAAQALAARRQVASSRADVLAALKQVDAARAQRTAADARLAQADVTVGYLHIRAPISGQVVNRQVNVGSYVAPGQQLMAIVPDDLWITANFKETQLTLMRAGQAVRIRIDAFPDRDFPGHVESIQRGAGQAFALLPPQNATGNYVKVVQRVPVRIRFDTNEWQHYAIGPGMSAVPRVTVRR